ncbi:TPA: ParB N-terminal domain-containing protein [Streptococcus suis]
MRTYSQLSNQQNIFHEDIEVNKVYRTTKYDIFGFSKFNRNVHLTKEMLNQAEQGFISPIVVNENLIVIDGQHRLTACKQLGIPVEYIIKSGLNDDDIVRMNTIQKPWKLINFIEAFANEGKEEYVKLINLLNTKDYYQSVAIISQIAMDEVNPRGMITPIQEGRFKFYNYEKTIEFLAFLSKFKKETKIPYRSNLSRAIYLLFKYKKIDMNKLITRVISSGLADELIVKSPNYSECVKELLDAYNFRISPNSPNYIEYFVSSNGSIKIATEKHLWAIRDFEKDEK